MQNYVFDIYVDVSGRPKSRQYFGLIAVNADFSHNFEKNFEEQFPELLKSKAKGKDLGEKKLAEIIDFFDANRAYFTSSLIKAEEWQKYRESCPGKSFFQERVYGAIYYRLLERVTKQNTSIKYTAILCEDNQLDTKKARGYTRNLLGAHDRKVEMSSGLYRDVPQLKFADFVAAAHRKLGYGRLKRIPHYKSCPPPIPAHILKRVFESRSATRK